MLKAGEVEIKKEHQVLMVNKTTSFKKKGKGKKKGNCRVSLAKPYRRTTTPSPPRRRAAFGDFFLNLSLSPCWIKARKTSPGRTCVERGGTIVRCLDRIRPRSELLRVRLHRPRSCNASALRSTMVCRCTPLPLVARFLHRLILVMRRKF